MNSIEEIHGVHWSMSCFNGLATLLHGKAISVVCLTLLLHAGAQAADRNTIFATRMSGRTTLDISRSFFHTKAKEDGEAVEVFLSAGLGAVRWDGESSIEGRVHFDAGFSINSGYFLIGAFATYGDVSQDSRYFRAADGTALGIRVTGGYKSRRNLMIGGYWEYTAGLPGATRGSRAGLGVQAGIRF